MGVTFTVLAGTRQALAGYLLSGDCCRHHHFGTQLMAIAIQHVPPSNYRAWSERSFMRRAVMRRAHRDRVRITPGRGRKGTGSMRLHRPSSDYQPRDGNHASKYQHDPRSTKRSAETCRRIAGRRAPSTADGHPLTTEVSAMKIWADLSVLLKLSFVCLAAGFILGLCTTGSGWSAQDQQFPGPSGSSTVQLTPMSIPDHTGSTPES